MNFNFEMPVPKYIVTDPLGNHVYKVVFHDERPSIEGLVSVSTQLAIIGGAKINILMNWAKKKVVERAQEQFDVLLKTDGAEITREKIEEILLTAKKEPKKIFVEAGDLGDVVHKYIDGWINCYLINKVFVYEHYVPASNKFFEQGKVGFETFQQWIKTHNLRPVTGDLAVASIKYKYAGRLDAIFTDGKYFYLMDWKTANYMDDGYTAQVAGYNMALLETYGFKCSKGIVVRIDKLKEGVVEPKMVNMAGAEQLWKDVMRMNKSYVSSKLWITKKNPKK